jgi:signal transduction histidine kinase
MLARSERESAWREMARQVAHEIKNPLTPMRLGIQMLQRSQADGAPDLPERTGRMCKTLIEQIDSLSNIASAFSDFAQMPRPEMQSVDLAAVLSGVHDLHRNQPGMHIGLCVPDGPVVVRADRDQLIRIFNNLIKNAIQAIPDHREGRIEIILRVDENNATASVRDNGSGMTPEVRERIFVPRFSTKSSGMGLGLAMVKGMVEGMGGTISLETVPDQGTTFYVQLGLERTE